MSNIATSLKLNERFNQELPADPIEINSRRQVEKSAFSYATPIKTANPKLVSSSKEVADLIGLSQKDLESEDFLQIITGNKILEGTKPFAMCYGGHQFGNWAGQLGDGRAINLTEVEHNGKTWALQLKGAGPTPYSRTADGLAVLRSSIREYLCSEAMYHLGVPTTRALSLALTGDEVLRDMMYNGNSAYEKGAIVCRVAPSFIRFGNFEIFASRRDTETLKQLVDYTIKHHYAHLGEPSKETYIAFLAEVAERTMKMIVHWQRVGFVHGVMNTDNLSILGLTIDFGPYGWLEGYDHGWTPNTTDRHQKRYRYENQPDIGLWNLLKLANALYPLIEEAAPLEAILHKYKADYEPTYHQMMKEKLGLTGDFEDDKKLVEQLEEVLHLTETDMTIFFRNLAHFTPETDIENAIDKDFLNPVLAAFYKPEELTGNILNHWKTWFKNYANRLKANELSKEDRKAMMDKANPKYVLRNYMAQVAIDAADNGDFTLVNTFLEMLRNPYAEQPEMEKWFAKRPEWARNKVGCSMLSCSS